MRIFLLLVISWFPLFGQDFKLPKNCQQAVVGVTSDWSSSHVDLGLYEKKNGAWKLVGTFWKGRIGRNGLASGLGLSPAVSKTVKKEGDGKAPAGVFSLGKAFGYAKSINKKPKLVYNVVTSKDLWVEDSGSILYNQHVQLTHEPSSTWEKKQQMRQNDYAHCLKLYIEHNAKTITNKPKAGMGSAIFFHIWRKNGGKATSGCTTMSATKLEQMISQIDPEKNPVYILLPKSSYLSYRSAWKLP